MKVKTDKNIVLIGASVGNGWKFPELQNRKNLSGYKLEFIPVFDSFDKGPAIDTLLMRENKPDTVIIKECSVYFPGDLADYKNKVASWVAALQKNNITPVLATSVPPGEPAGVTAKIKESIKGAIGKPRKIDNLMEYNDWIRSFAKEKGLKVLDLEATLRISAENRYLDPVYDRGDKVHLNAEAYKKLDEVAEKLLNTIQQ